MKNLSLALNVVLIIAVGVLYYLHFSSPKQINEQLQSKEEKDSTVSEPEKIQLPEIRSINGPIAFIDAEQVNEKYAYIKDAERQLNNYFEQKKNQLQNKANQLRDSYARFAEDAKLLAPEVVAEKEEEFRMQQYELMQEEQKLQDELVTKQEENYKSLLKKIDSYLRELSKEKNYSYVFTYIKGGPATIVFANDSLEITDQVITGLNNDYKAKKGK